MSDVRPWQVMALTDEALTLRLTRPLVVRELLLALLGSKAAAHRVLARDQLSLVSTQGASTTMLTASSALAAEAVVRLRFWRAQARGEASARLRRDASQIAVVHQDPLLLAVDKPAGVLVHGDGTGAPTLTDSVQAYLARCGRPSQAQAVQRLDVDTTGLVLFSLTEEFQPALDAQVAGHDMGKRYLAVCTGALDGAPGAWRELRWPVGRDRHDARKMRAGSGKPACTRVQVLGRAAGSTLVLVELLTGRRHQIRVHLAHAGHPLVGDVLYGGARSTEGLMLHAWQESLVHPATGERLTLRTALPSRFVRAFPRAQQWAEQACPSVL